MRCKVHARATLLDELEFIGESSPIICKNKNPFPIINKSNSGSQFGYWINDYIAFWLFWRAINWQWLIRLAWLSETKNTPFIHFCWFCSIPELFDSRRMEDIPMKTIRFWDSQTRIKIASVLEISLTINVELNLATLDGKTKLIKSSEALLRHVFSPMHTDIPMFASDYEMTRRHRHQINDVITIIIVIVMTSLNVLCTRPQMHSLANDIIPMYSSVWGHIYNITARCFCGACIWFDAPTIVVSFDRIGFYVVFIVFYAKTHLVDPILVLFRHGNLLQLWKKITKISFVGDSDRCYWNSP